MPPEIIETPPFAGIPSFPGDRACRPREDAFARPAEFRGVGVEVRVTRFPHEDAIIRSTFCRSVTDCEDCASTRRVSRRVHAKEHSCGLDVVPPSCWVMAAARRVSAACRVQRKCWPGRCPATLLGRPTRNVSGRPAKRKRKYNYRKI